MASSPRRTSRAVNPAQLLSLFLGFLLVAATGGLLTAGMAMPMVAAVGATSEASTRLFDELPTELGNETLSEQSTMYAEDGTLLATFYAENRIVVPLEDISENMIDAVIAIEDQRFYDHGGVDPEGLMRAAVENLTGASQQGGSTLTQQYVKNVLIEAGQQAGDPEAVEEARAPTLGRKLREAKLAISVERVKTKDEILEGYLNIAQFGRSQWGVETASQYYFNKDAADLSVGESAVLARITQSPARWDPETNPENAEAGRNTVLATMLRQDFITQEEHDEAVEEEIEDMLDITPTQNGCTAAGNAAYFCDYVVRTILQDPAFGDDTDERRQLLNRGGLEIQTTIDLDAQDAAHETVMNNVPADDPSGVSSAISTVEPGTGEIVAMTQNTEHGPPTESNPRGTQVNFNVDRAYGGGGGFPTGSTFKVFVLAEWLRSGNSLSEIVDGSPGQHFPRSSWNFSCAPTVADDYDPGNIEGIGTGPMSVLDATEQSVNTAFVDMANQLDVCDIDELARSTGMHLGTGVDEASGRALRLSPSMVLGPNEIAPLTMAASFATFASGGTYCRPIAITGVTGPDGEDIPVPEQDCEQVLDSDVVNGMNHALQRVVGQRSGTGWRADIPDRPTAGKTGTSNDNGHAWFVGYVPQLATAVWVGHSEGNVPMQNITVNGQFHRNLFGGAVPAPMFGEYMSQATDGMSVENFPEADDEQIHGDRIPVPNVVGQSVNSATDSLEGAGFAVEVGDEVDSGNVDDGDVARTSPSSGSRVQPGSTITLEPSGSSDDDDDENDDDDNGDDSNGDDDDE